MLCPFDSDATIGHGWSSKIDGQLSEGGHLMLDMPGIMYGTAWKEEQTSDLVLEALDIGS